MAIFVPTQTLIVNAFRYFRDDDGTQRLKIPFVWLVQYRNKISELLAKESPEVSITFDLTEEEVEKFCRENSRINRDREKKQNYLFFGDQLYLLNRLDDLSFALATNPYPVNIQEIFKRATNEVDYPKDKL